MTVPRTLTVTFAPRLRRVPTSASALSRALTPAPTLPRVLWITDPHWGEDTIVRTIAKVASAIPPGAFGVQLRDKACAQVALRLTALRLRAVTRAVGATLFVNGSPEVARDVGADGVHLRADGVHRDSQGRGVEEARRVVGRPTWVSIAAHTDDDVARARASGADAVLVSPIFATRPMGPAGPGAPKAGRGTAALRAARARADGIEAGAAWSGVEAGAAWPGTRSPAGRSPRRVFVFALGGVTPETARECVAAGADGVALVSAILFGGEPSIVARALHDVFTRR